MAKAIWKDQVLAESNETIQLEGNHYFPPSSINKEFFKDSDHTSYCMWKGDASYYSIEVNGELNKDAAWYYAEPYKDASHIKGYIGFWKGVEVMEK